MLKMSATISQGQICVAWNDHSSPAFPLELQIAGQCFQLQEEQTLRDLYDCLEFLYGNQRREKKPT